MTKPQQLRYAALCRIDKICTDNSAVLDIYPEALIERTNLHNCILKLEKAKELALANLKPIAFNKAFRQKAMIDTVFKYMLRSSIKAGQEGEIELKVSLSISRYKVTQNRDTTIAALMEKMKDIMKNNLGILTNLDNDAITEMENAILAYNKVGNAPKKSSNKRKALGTDLTAQLLNDGDLHKANMIKLFHSYLPDQAPLIDVSSRVGKHTGIRHISIAIQVFIARTDIPLKNVKCTLTNSSDTIVHRTTQRGWAKFYSLHNSSWNITIEYPTYKTAFLLNIIALEGKITRLRFDIEKIE